MPNFGGLNNTVKVGGEFFYDVAFSGLIGSAANFPSTGTIDTVHWFCERQTAPARTARTALYIGGVSNTDPNGATIIWDSGEIANATIPAALAWMDLPTGGIAITAGTRLWCALKTVSSGIILAKVDSPDAGDMTLSQMYAVGLGNDQTVPFSSPIGATGPSILGGWAWKWRVTYSTGAAAAIDPGIIRGSGTVVGPPFLILN